MTMKILLVAQRPDTSAPFWWDSGRPAAIQAATQTLEVFESIGATQTTDYSEDTLTCTRTIIVPSPEVWDVFMNVVFTLPDVLADRKTYFSDHNHTLTLTKVDVDSDAVTGVIPDAIAHLSK